MCSKCGLIFDFHFSDEWEPVRYEAWQDHETGEWESVEFCSRCDVSFQDEPPTPITVKGFEPEETSVLTFFVEDKMQKLVVETIAKQLEIKVSVEDVGNSSRVIESFKSHRSKRALANRYFMIDGDNRSKLYSTQSSFVQLERYCMENYLLDFNVCAAISGKSPDQIRTYVFDLLKSRRDLLIGKDALMCFLFDRLNISDFESLLVYLDASKIFVEFMEKIGMGKNKEHFVEKYVKHCHSISKMRDILPVRLVKVIQGAVL
jgi:hypothetical protein